MHDEIKIHNRHAFDNWKVATPLLRVAAFLIDSALVLFLCFGLFFALDQSPSNKAIFLLWFSGMWIWDAVWLSFFGSTPAKKALGLYVFSPRFDGAPHPVQVCIRIMTFWLGFFLLGMGLTPALVRKDRRGWHDLLSETLVLGPKKSLPSSLSQNVGNGFLLAQVLIVFGFFGAYILSLGIKETKSDERLANQCDEPGVFVSNTPEVLFALSISPAWSDCWKSLERGLASVSDSKLVELGKLANSLQDVWVLPTEIRVSTAERLLEKYQQEICSGDDGLHCKTARHLASLPSSDMTNESASWLNKYGPTLRQLVSATTREERLKVLESELDNQKHPIVVSAIRERIWAERLSSGNVPKKVPTSMNITWSETQKCWSQGLGVKTQNCRSVDAAKVAQVVYMLRTQELTNNEIESLIVEYEELQSNDDLLKVLRYMLATNSNEDSAALELWSKISEINPFYSLAWQFREKSYSAE